MNRSVIKKMTAVVMCITVMFSFCACNLAEQIRHRVHNRISVQGELPVQELSRLLIGAINDKRNTADAYSSIPEDQNGGLSYSYFYEYMNIMRSVSTQDNNGKVISFRVLNDTDCINLIGQRLYERYGTVKGVELLYNEEAEYPVYLFFSEDSEGKVSLSAEWITSVINIYNYGNHYFTLLESGNSDAVEALLRPGFTGDEYTESVLYAKANQLCEFYRLRVMSDSSEYEIVRLVPNQMVIRVPETIAPDGSMFENHLVTLDLQSDGTYTIEDEVNLEPDLNLVFLVRGDERLVRVGNTYTYDQLVSVMGEPPMINMDEESGMVIVIYAGVLLRFDGEIIDSTNWEGTLTSIRLIANSTYSIGYNLYVGMSRSQILTAYPFVDESEYIISINSGSRMYEVVFGFDENDIVNTIKVSG